MPPLHSLPLPTAPAQLSTPLLQSPLRFAFAALRGVSFVLNNRAPERAWLGRREAHAVIYTLRAKATAHTACWLSSVW